MEYAKYKILLVEDDMIIAADISMQLSKIGYQILGISTHAEDALNIIKSNPPDLILMDVILSGKMNGIEAAIHILKHHQIPVIFTTSNTDDATFQQALLAKPYAFLPKPFHDSILVRTIEIALSRKEAESSEPEAKPQVENKKAPNHFSFMEDRIFIRYNKQLEKISIANILYVEAERNYCRVYTEDKEYLLSVPLSSIESQLPNNFYVRVHRSFLVNISKVDTISDHHESLKIKDVLIPISRRMKDNIIERIKVL